ncbi:unnamed protein product [Adineta steineri]|uniref:Potassium transporter n=1 Tax=Adineta steineri TaxID=433720 RepID=A0A815IDH5_9BILA|nr:unnamed protein product [Adineta steineri]CAF3525295.1 unnamed protein product [Adineta steineri]
MVQSPVMNRNVHIDETGNNNKIKLPFELSEHNIDTTKITPRTNLRVFLSLTIGSLGIIFGDIGTSPLYVLNTIFAENLHPTPQQCIGAISLIIWNLIIVVTIKYAIFILMADNNGEGGTFALCGLLTGENSKLRARAKHVVSIIAILAASLLIGDGAITPAISVLSAIEGLAVTSESLTKWVVPITVVIIIALFFVQMFGTSKIGLTFAPIMLVWFAVIFSIGIWRITFDPTILRAFNPWEAISYLIREKKQGFIQIGGVFLSVTGLEALYADLGHFGRWPIRTSWLAVVLPSVMANYLGQGALIMHHPEYIYSPFYNAAPAWARWPMIVLATLATIIASQAIITGVFSLMNQASSLGFAPPLRVIHTSKKVIGQIYVPAINWIIMLITIAITLLFRSSASLAHAYGVTVCSVMCITTILYICVMRYVWNHHWCFVLLFGVFSIIDFYFLAANAIKFLEGAWVALLIAILFFLIGFCWYHGQTLLRRYLHVHAQTTALVQLSHRLGIESTSEPILTPDNGSLSRRKTLPIEHQAASSDEDDDVEKKLNPKIKILPPISDGDGSSISNRISFIYNVDHTEIDTNSSSKTVCTVTPGLGVFLTTSSRHTPHVFERVLDRMHALPQIAIFLKMEYARIPVVDVSQRLKVRTYGSEQRRIYHITACFGYSEHKIQLPEILKLAARDHNIPIPDNRNVTFFIPAISIRVKHKGWRLFFTKCSLIIYSVLKNMFPFGQKNLQLPHDQTVSVGMVVPL